MPLGRNLFAALALALLSAPVLLAQGGEDNPLETRDVFPRVGAEFGLNFVEQSGTYIARCGTFPKGARTDPFFGICFDDEFAKGLRYEVMLFWQGKGVSSSYISTEPVVVETPDGRQTAAVDFENVGDFNASYIGLMPSAKWYPTKGLYAGAGLGVGFLLGANTQYTKNIVSKVVQVNNIGLSEVYYPETESTDPYSKVYEAEDEPNAAGLALDGVIFVGAEIPIGSRIRFGPRLMLQLPLTPVLDNPELKLGAFTVTLGFRYNLSNL